jgi:hypothetical protein
MLAHVAFTWLMVGVIWIVQLVQYPLFRLVPPAGLPPFAQAHASGISLLVAPAMVLEVLTGLALFWLIPKGMGLTFWLWFGLVLLACIWLATALLSVPCHQQLALEYDATVIERLVATNWVRTLLWSLRGVAVLAIAVKVFK